MYTLGLVKQNLRWALDGPGERAIVDQEEKYTDRVPWRGTVAF